MDLEKLIGRKILKVRMNKEFLIFETDKGNFGFRVYGDCCSYSFFYDFFGVEKLIKNGPVVGVKELSLEVEDYTIRLEEDVVQAYGYEIVTVNEDYGEQTSVFSFRNDSNGYYGGWMESLEDVSLNIPEIKGDVLLGTD